MFSFDKRLNGPQALERLVRLQAVWALLELISSYFDCINPWSAWQYIHFVISIPIFAYMASVIVQRMNDIGWSRNFGFGGAAALFIANTILLIFAQHSLVILIIFAVIWAAAAGALFTRASEPIANEFGEVPSDQLNLTILLVTVAAIAGFITAGFSIECDAPVPYEPPLQQTPIPQPSAYRSCLSCCDAKGYFINCGCREVGNGYQCFGG